VSDLKKLKIVFEETGSTNDTIGVRQVSFKVYLEGDISFIKKPEDHWSPAEFWAHRSLHTVIKMLELAGVIKNVAKA
jgi:hypothetical protein